MSFSLQRVLTRNPRCLPSLSLRRHPFTSFPLCSSLSKQSPAPPSFSRSFSSAFTPKNHRQYRSNDRNRPEFLGFLDRIPHDTLFWGAIAANGLVFAMWYLSTKRYQLEGNPTTYKWMVENFTVSWRNLSQGRVWTLVTSCFSHENIGHILFNGFTFYFMARPVLSMLGSRQFLFLYLGGGLFANLASVGWNNVVKHRDAGSYGASAAIYSVVSFLACVAPTMTFQLYGIIPIPAWLAVAGIFTYDTYSAVKDKRRGTDTAGHVAGLLAGAGYFLVRRYRIL